MTTATPQQAYYAEILPHYGDEWIRLPEPCDSPDAAVAKAVLYTLTHPEASDYFRYVQEPTP